MTTKEFAKCLPHGELREVFADVFFVTGTLSMPGPLPIRFSRAMTVVREGGALTLVNSVRLDESGLAALDKLGKVKNVLRLAGFHGMDDPFYKDRYGARVWTVKGQLYTKGLGSAPKKSDAYFEPDEEMDEDSNLPIAHAKLFEFKTATVPEGVLLLDRDGGIAIAGDALQNWAKTDDYFSLPGKIMMKAMGFIKPVNIGPGWLRAAKPQASDVKRILDLPFEHLLPAHGAPVIGQARESYRPAIEKLQ